MQASNGLGLRDDFPMPDKPWFNRGNPVKVRVGLSNLELRNA